MVMLLDAPSAPAYAPCGDVGRGQKHWVGGNGEWVTVVQDLSRWYLLNVYVEIHPCYTSYV